MPLMAPRDPREAPGKCGKAGARRTQAWAGVGQPGLGPAPGLGALSLLTLVHDAAALPRADEGPVAAAEVAAVLPGCVRRGGPAPSALGGPALRTGGARSPLPLPALRGTALQAWERRASRRRRAQSPQTPSAGGSTVLPRMRRRQRPFVPAVGALRCLSWWLIAIRSRVVGGEICFRVLLAQNPTNGPCFPKTYRLTQKGAHYIER